MRVRVLGTLALDGDDGASVPLRSPRLRRLLAVLVAAGGEVVSVYRIADVVWGDDPPASVEGAVHTIVSKLRTALREAGIASDGDRGLLTRAPGYLLLLPDGDVDADRFARLLADARQAREGGRSAEAAELLDAALALWHGPAYAEFADAEFARGEATRLEELRTTAREERLEIALDMGRTGEAVAACEALVTEHPLRERPRSLLMRALYRAGRQADALQVYRAYREELDRELGLDPSAHLQALEAAILRQDPRLDGPERPVDARSAEEGGAHPGAAAPAPRAFPDQPDGADSGRLSVRAGAGPPRMATRLIGRADLLADVLDDLGRVPMVTLTGPGGVGKTSLALDVARAAQGDRFPDGVWVCELDAVDDADAAAEAIAAVLGAHPHRGVGEQAQTVVERLVDFLRPRRLLLVLDNTEHVADVIARLTEAVIRSCPDVVVLATGREPLGVTGEQVRVVPPLDVPTVGGRDAASVELFVSRARAAAADIVLDDATMDDIAEICRRLDGLPLAIELAAMRVPALTPREVLERLDGRFRLLRSGRRIAAERHRTLRAVVDWSYQLLDAEEQRVFERLSVFAGGFDLQGAEAVAADGTLDALAVADLVAGLVDKSMVLATAEDGATWYRLLETLRAYGRDRLRARGALDATAGAHARYYAAFCERADACLAGPEHAAWIAAVSRRMNDIRSAHSWALDHDIDTALRIVAALFSYAEHRIAGEVGRWAEATVGAATAAGVTSPALAAACAVAAAGARLVGDLPRARARAQQGLAAAGDHPAQRIRPLYVLGEVAGYEGRLEDAEDLAAQAHRTAREVGDTNVTAYAGVNLVLSTAYRGDADRARVHADELTTWAATTDNPVAVAWARYAGGESLLETEPERALVLLEEALQRARALGERYLEGAATVSIVSLQGRQGDPHDAMAGLLAAVRHWHGAGNWIQQWTTVRNVTVVLARAGKASEAAVIVGALDNRETAAPEFGADADRLAAVRRHLRDLLGPSAWEAARRRGRAMTDEEVVAYVQTALAGPSSGVPPADTVGADG